MWKLTYQYCVMNWVWIVSVLVMCIIPVSQGYDTVKVGVILTFNSTNGRVSKIAMEAARDDINSDPTILGGRKLSLMMHDSNYSGFVGFVGALRFMETNTMAIIGPQSSVLARILSQVTTEVQIPLLSFTALDHTMSPRQYPYFIQTAPTDLYMVTAIADIVGYYCWGDVIAIYNDEDQFRSGINMLHSLLLERRSKVSYKAAIRVNATRSEVQEVLVKFLSMKSCVVIVNTYSLSGLLVLDVARSLGMVREGYVWIATSWLSNLLDSGSLDTHSANFFQGVLTLKAHTPDSKRKRNFMQRWKHLSNGSIGLNPCGLYAYDTVWMIARAVRLFLEQGNNISFSHHTKLSDLSRGTLNLKALSKFEGGEKLRNIILRTNMTGLTGPIQFNLDRSVRYPSYDIINVIQGGSRLVGYWSNHSGLSIVPPETLYGYPPNRSRSNQHLSTVVWPGGGKVVPRGWIFPHNGKPLRIGVPNKTIYKRLVSKVNGTNEVRGYCIDVFLAAKRLLPYDLPYEFIPFGDGHKNPNYSELVDKIQKGVFDVVVGDISIVAERTKNVDFTQPFIESGLVVVAPLRKTNSSAWSFLQPFTLSMWGVLGLFFLFVGAVVWLLEHRRNDEFRGPPKKQFVTVLWFSFSTMFMAHRESVQSPLGRFVVIIWLFVILIINSSYTASLTSILTVQQMASPITGIESLVSVNVAIGYQVGSFAEKYLRDELNIPGNRLIPLGSQTEFDHALVNGTVAAVVEEKPYIDLFLAKHCKFSIRGNKFTKSGWGFAFRKDSPIAEDMSTAILRLSENGELERLGKQWLSRKMRCHRVQSDPSDQLEVRSFVGLFLMCGIVCFVALVIYLWSTIYKFKRHCPVGTRKFNGKRGTKFSRGMRRVRSFMSYADDKADVWINPNGKRKHREDGDDDDDYTVMRESMALYDYELGRRRIRDSVFEVEQHER